MSSEIRKEDNPTPYIVIREGEYDPERHILPQVIKPLRVGDIVGLQPVGGGDRPLYENVLLAREESNLWLIHRVGIVRKDYDELGDAFVYAVTGEVEDSDTDLIYVTLKPGLYMSGLDHFEVFQKKLLQKFTEALGEVSELRSMFWR